MKLRSILCGVLAIAAAVACKPDDVVETPKLDVDKTAVSVTAEAGQATFNVTTNQDWTASADADWVSVNPNNGKASDKAVAVKVTAEDNATEAERTATVTVKAGTLSKTVKVTQAAKATTPEPPVDEPEFEVKELYMLGSACDTGWSLDEMQAFANDGGIFTWTGNLNSEGEFRFPLQKVSNQWWPCLMISADGKSLVYGTSDDEKVVYNVPETGNYTITIDARDVKNMAVEVVYNGPVTEGPEVSWGLMGCFVDNLWATDVPMTKEGEWIVAKNAQFTELTFKIRGNASWNDKHNMGYAPGTEKGLVNARLAVVTAEYSKANLGGDCVDIKLNGPAGTYDVYFSYENLEVYVMEPGYKPGEREPIQVEPKDVTYTVVGTLNNINWNNSAPEGLMTKEGDYYVAKNVPLVTAKTLYDGADQIEFKIVETGTWDGYGVAAGTAAASANAEIAVVAGGDNIPVVAAEGAYDVYFDKANAKVWVMTPGYKPGDEVPGQGGDQPQPETAELTTFLSFQSNVANGQNTVTVQLATSGLSMETVTSEYGSYQQMTGEGKYFKFDVYSADGTLAPGTYTASAVGGTVAAGEFSIGYDVEMWGMSMIWGTAWMTHNADGTETGVKITDGTLNVAVSGDVYTITLESSALNATYTGKLSNETTEPENPETEPVTEGVIWQNDGSVGVASWGGSPYRFSIEGGDSQNECCAEIPAAVWAGMKIAPFYVDIQPAPEASWWQIRILDGWWTNNDEAGTNDITPQYPGLISRGNGTYTFEVNLASNPDLLALIDTQHLLFAGDGFTIQKMSFDKPEQGGSAGSSDNIVSNGDFESGATGWMGWSWGPFTQDLDEGREGGTSIVLTLEACTNLWDAQIVQDVPALEPGTYVYQFYAKSEAPEHLVQVFAQEVVNYQGIYGPNTHYATDEWTLFTGEVVYDGTIENINRIGIQFGLADASGAKLWIDDFTFGLKK